MNELQISPRINIGGLTINGPHATMSQCETVSQLIAARPTRARVLEKWGIPYCCGRQRSLQDACTDLGIDVRAVLTDIRESDARALGLPHCHNGFTEWNSTPLSEFAQHLTEMHHEYLRRELSRLSNLLSRVAGDHGQHFSDLWEMEALFLEFEQQTLEHLDREEQQLFSLLKHLDGGVPLPENINEMIRNAVAAFRNTHDELRAILNELRSLSGNYTPPENACATYRVLFFGLTELDVEVQRHFGEEEDNLFPRVLDMTMR
jgi:regulator of cell morphogenesis and NO signaling